MFCYLYLPEHDTAMRPGPLAFFFCILLSLSFRQDTPYPQGHFLLPVDGQPRLSGTFGELRPGHFHSGLDIKGYLGQPLMATAAGYISRIEVNSGGYGKALFLNHDNGFTSVYAHLGHFSPEVESYVKSYQYARESFEIALEPESSRFPVEAGTVVGYVGLTGYSFGPHLHFELRESGGGPAANPLLFGLPVSDHRPPAIQALRLYTLDSDGTALRTAPKAVRGNRGRYRLVGSDTLYTDSPLTGFSLKAFDQLDGADNMDGIFALQLFIGDSLAYELRMASIGQKAAAYYNAHIDYAAQMQGEGLFHRCYRMPGDASPLYHGGNGAVALPPGGVARLSFLARDLAGNTARLDCWLKRRPQAQRGQQPLYYNYFLPFNEASIIQAGDMYAYFPDSSFYEDLFFDYQASLDASHGVYSLVHHLHDGRTPVHGYYLLAIRPTQPIPDEARAKTFIAYCNENNEIVNCGGAWRDGMLHARLHELGDYCIMADVVPPRIEALSFQEDMRLQAAVQFRATDNVSAGAGLEKLKYRGTIDGRWVLFSYDEKEGVLEHLFEKELAPGRHSLRLEVADAVGNLATFEGDFYR
ncbi:MAG: M23 family metallopeptidase [Phaeodactylibacter sp.]|nr:M23 family metallopeptidase [Phaeodactylibacter sp.]MCB9272757.1 M23 family metallopeptidase [Lewinellaceae bacterium]